MQLACPSTENVFVLGCHMFTNLNGVWNIRGGVETVRLRTKKMKIKDAGMENTETM